MRALGGVRDADQAGDRLIHHANIRSNLAFMKSVVEGGRAMVLDLALLYDHLEAAKSSSERDHLRRLVQFYSPVTTAFLAEFSTRVVSTGLQIFGGHGYICGNGMEQLLRDATAMKAYQGTVEVLSRDFFWARVVQPFTREINELERNIRVMCRPLMIRVDAIGKFARRLWVLQKEWMVQRNVITIASKDAKNAVPAGADDFTLASGLVIAATCWLRIAVAAKHQIQCGNDQDGYYTTKLQMCEFFFSRVLPMANGLLRTAAGDSLTLMNVEHTVPRDSFFEIPQVILAHMDAVPPSPKKRK
jgi:hypothetical protein